MKITEVVIKNAKRKISDDGNLIIWISHPDNMELNPTPKGRNIRDISVYDQRNTQMKKAKDNDVDIAIIPNR